MPNNTLDQLINDAWALWDQAHQDDNTLVPQDSAPILWFGNEQRYQQSNVKIVTIGVNPGPLSFPKDDPWTLYPKLENPETRRDVNTYQADRFCCWHRR